MSAFIIPHLQDPHGDARYSAGEKAGDEDESHSRDKLDGAFDFSLFVQSPVSQLPGNSDGAKSHDGSGKEKLDDVKSIVPSGQGGEAHADVEALTLCAVAVVEKVLTGEKVPSCKKNQSPKTKGDTQSVAQAEAVYWVSRVDNLEVTVDSHSCEEEDPRCTIGGQQEEENTARDVTVDPVFPTPVVVRPEG